MPDVSKNVAQGSADATAKRSSRPKTKTATTRRPRAASSGQAAGKPGVWNLRLYIAGEGQKSRAALRNLKDLCERHLGDGKYHIEIIDLIKDPQLAKVDQILAIPTLVRKIPEPMKRVIGDLSNAERAMLALDLRDVTSE